MENKQIMKRFAFISGIVLAALAMTNCTNKEFDTLDKAPVKAGVPFKIIAQPSEELKTTVGDNMSILWDSENDKLNVFHKLSSDTDFTSDGQFYVADATTGTFSGSISNNVPTDGNNYDWVAIYPYNNLLTSFAPTNRFYYVGCRSDQSQFQNGTNSTAHLAGYDDSNTKNFPLWGKKENVPYSASPSGDYVSPVISMNQVCSVLAFNITNTTSAAISVSEIDFTATEDIVGSYNIDFSGETPIFSPYNDYQSSTVVLEVTNGTIAAGQTGIFYVGIKPFTVEGTDLEPKKLTMVVKTTGGEVQSKEFSVKKTMTFSANKYKNVFMDFSLEHNTEDFVQISSMDDILLDAEYLLVLPDGADSYYYAIQVAGTSGNLKDISSGIAKENGLLKYNSPDPKLIWTIANISLDGGYNFKNGEYCIWKPSSGTDIDTKHSGTSYWTLTDLDDNVFSFKSGERYLAMGTQTTLIKNYDHFVNQVAQAQSLSQYSGAWAILRRGGTVLPSPKISFATSSYIFTLDDVDYSSFTGQALTNPYGVNVTWSSSNENLATVSDGTVSFVPNAVGTTTISASFTSDGNYKTETVSYTITVKSGANGYILVDSAPDDWSGKYVIAYVNDNNAILLGAKSSSGNFATYSNSIAIVNNVIDASAGGPYQVSIDKTTNGYSILFEGSSSYLGYTGTSTSSNNYLFYDTTFASSKYEWTITLGSSALATIKNVYNTSRVLKYNSISGQERFACYTGNTQNLVKLFKLQGDEPELSPLASIAVSGQQTQFIEGVDFSLGNNCVVTATYEDGSTRDVTSLVTVSGYNKNTLGQQTVTLSYTEGDVTKTTSYTVTVVAKTVTELQLSAYTATWTVGNTWAWDGTAKAKYDNGSTTTLTVSDISFTYKNASNVSVTAEAMMSMAGNYTITASYTENGTTVTADIEITVNNAVTNGYDETFTFNSAAWGSTNSNGYDDAFTSGKNGNLNGGYVQVTTGNTGANATSNYVFGDLQTVKVVYHTNASNGVGTISVKVGETTKTFNVTKPSSGGTTDKTATFDFSAESPTGTATLTVTCTTNSIYIKSIEFIGDGEISEVVNGDGVTVSMSSFSAISGNVGGDENISYLAEKGSASTAPAVNSNQIRIYQNGGLLTVSANNGKKITSITIGSAMGTTVQVKVDTGSYSSNNSINAGERFTKDNIEASSVTFKCTGTTASTRLYLNYLSVTYQ